MSLEVEWRLKEAYERYKNSGEIFVDTNWLTYYSNEYGLRLDPKIYLDAFYLLIEYNFGFPDDIFHTSANELLLSYSFDCKVAHREFRLLISNKTGLSFRAFDNPNPYGAPTDRMNVALDKVIDAFEYMRANFER